MEILYVVLQIDKVKDSIFNHSIQNKIFTNKDVSFKKRNKKCSDKKLKDFVRYFDTI